MNKYYVMWKVAGQYYGSNGPYNTEDEAESHRLNVRESEGVEQAWYFAIPEGTHVLSAEEMNKAT